MIKEFILRNTVFKKRLYLLKKKKKLYQDITNKDDIYNYQLDKFNDTWKYCIETIPFYKMWQQKHNLSDSIKNIEELKTFPILTKKDIQENQDLIFNHLNNYSTISTGGSSGEPTKFPIGNIEQDINYTNNYMAKSWWGLNPLDKIILIWGHSHLFGSGFKGIINKYKRIIFDWAINTTRLNAYDMSLNSLKRYYECINSSKSSFVIGYTSAIVKLAKYMQNNKLSLSNNCNIKGVIVTSETVSNEDIKIIEDVFKAPCIIEYGMAETGVIAYSKESSNELKVFWDSFLCIKSNDNNLLVSTITNKLFPLINYQTSDIIDTVDEVIILDINRISGRNNDFLKLKVDDKTIDVHSEFFTHIIKSIENIIDFKLIQKKNLSIEIQYISTVKKDIKESFFIEISKEFAGIEMKNFSFVQVDSIDKTIAGKSKWIEIEE
jgi:phenylacetate-coenzyme A ligase PaaK-like adenylate-forming protein